MLKTIVITDDSRAHVCLNGCLCLIIHRLNREGHSVIWLQERLFTVHWKGNIWSQHWDSTTISSGPTSPKTDWKILTTNALSWQEDNAQPWTALHFLASRESFVDYEFIIKPSMLFVKTCTTWKILYLTRVYVYVFINHVLMFNYHVLKSLM